MKTQTHYTSYKDYMVKFDEKTFTMTMMHEPTESTASFVFDGLYLGDERVFGMEEYDSINTRITLGRKIHELTVTFVTEKEMSVQEKLSNISAELETLATARNATELATTENVMKIAAEDKELSSYNQVLCIDLEESGKDKVLEAIAVLEKRDHILLPLLYWIREYPQLIRICCMR